MITGPRSLPNYAVGGRSVQRLFILQGSASSCNSLLFVSSSTLAFYPAVVVWIHTLCLLPFCLLPVAVHFLLSSWTLLFVFYLCKPFRSKCIKSLPIQFHQPTCCLKSESEILSSHCPASSFVSFCLRTQINTLKRR